MKITIVVPDNTIGIDGTFRSYDLSDIDARVVQFDTAAGTGHVEYVNSNNRTIDTTYYNDHFKSYSDLYLADAAAEEADRVAKEGIPFPVWSSELGRYVSDLAEYKEDLAKRVKLKRDEIIALGVPFLFPDGLAGTIQTRDATDFRNISAIATAGLALMVSQSQTGLVFRDTENVVHNLTGAEAINMGLYVTSYIQGIYNKCWAKENEIINLANSAACDAYDVNAGWQ